MHMTFCCHQLGSLSIIDADGNENGRKAIGLDQGACAITTVKATKTSLTKFIPSRSIRSMLAIFSGFEFHNTIKVQGKKKEIVFLCSRPPQNVALGIFKSQSCSDDKEMQKKSVMHVQSCCFANRSLLLFLTLSLTSLSSLLNKLPFSKTTTWHVLHDFVYISLPSLHDHDVELPNFKFSAGSEQKTRFAKKILFSNLETVLQNSTPNSCQIK